MIRMSKATSAEDYRLANSFDSVRRVLLDPGLADRLEKPLAYWVLPRDRRLPLALLGRTVGSLLATPFEELSATPGIGHKKIASLVKLLNRAAQSDAAAVATAANNSRDLHENVADAPISGGFDPSSVSEVAWQRWCETIRRHELGYQKLGRLAPTLAALPTVVWNTPLGFYVDRTLAEIRQLKTHGEKRVRAVLEVFYVVHDILAQSTPKGHLSVRLVAGFVPPIERWIAHAFARPELPTFEEIRDHVTVPLLDQIRVDAGEHVVRLAETRLGVRGTPLSVRMQSRRLGVTRARVYQLLEDCGHIMDVRWPEGKHQLFALGSRLKTDGASDETKRLFDATRELFFPDRFDSTRKVA
jgi:hypothetical protein